MSNVNKQQCKQSIENTFKLYQLIQYTTSSPLLLRVKPDEVDLRGIVYLVHLYLLHMSKDHSLSQSFLS